MEITINSKALENINEKAERLLLLMQAVTINSPKVEKKYNDDEFAEKIIELKKENIIGDLIGHGLLGSEEISVYIYEKDYKFGFFGNNFSEYIKLVETIHNRNELRDLISINTLKKILFKWVISQYKRETNVKLMEYVINFLKENVKEYEIIFPINKLVVDNFKLGKIELIKITKDKINDWQEELSLTKKDTPNGLTEVFEKIRTDTQGYSAASINIFAEQERAFELALEETNKSISALRFFSEANLHPEFISSCNILGTVNLELMHSYTIESGLFIGKSSISNINREYEWVISKEQLESMRHLGLDELHQILTNDKLTDFQNHLLNSLFIYSNSSLMNNLNDKLIYILVSIESLLLKDSNESISQNIGERIAFMIGNNVISRKIIIKNIKDIYSIRSKFIHHGLNLHDKNIFREFLENIWKFYIHLIKSHLFFKSKEDLLNYIEEKKLS